MPDIYIIAGPNGVGKTTYARDFLPTEVQCIEFLNADLIAQGLSPFDPERASFRAGRIMLEMLAEFIKRGESFGFETTLSGRGYTRLFREARLAGYQLYLDFLWVPNLELSRRRVAQRVSKGGHNISQEVQRRRFLLGVNNLFSIYRPLLDRWRLFDNSLLGPECVAEEIHGTLHVHRPELFDSITSGL